VGGARSLAARANLRLVVRSASRTICVSESERGEVMEVVGSRAAGRVVLIHNAVPIASRPSPEERSAARQALGIPDGVVAGAWVGGLDPVKDPLIAAAAASEVGRGCPGFVLLVAGDGMLRPDVERVVVEHSGAPVRLLGFRRDVRQVLAAADFYVLSSQREGLSFSLLEAMATGLPAVVSDAPGNRDAVGDAGLVVPRGDASAFAAAFRRLRDDERLRAVLGEQARNRVAEHFTAEQMVQRTRSLYDAILRQDARWEG
jgi:glycosyltransferase involved in cell wall biosynthesis